MGFGWERPKQWRRGGGCVPRRLRRRASSPAKGLRASAPTCPWFSNVSLECYRYRRWGEVVVDKRCRKSGRRDSGGGAPRGGTDLIIHCITHMINNSLEHSLCYQMPTLLPTANSQGSRTNCQLIWSSAVCCLAGHSTVSADFVSADLRSAQRGGQELERLASAQTCADLPEGKVMCAGEALLFNTAWWHAGPGQPAGSDCRRVIFIPLTGGTKRRSSQTERKPKRPRRNL